MKKIFFPIVTLATLLVAGCAKENIVESQKSATKLTAGAPATRTVLQNDQKVLWINGDQINVNGVESEALVLDTPAATATFTIPAVLNDPFKAVFPASIYKDAQTVTLPAVQAYAEGSFGPNVSPMAAYQEEGNNLKFQNLCAVLKLYIAKGEDADEIAYVEFRGKNSEKVCGDFALDYEAATLAPVGAAGDDEQMIKVNVERAIPEDGNLVVYIVVPAIEFAKGYTVRVVDANGHYMEVSKKSAHTPDAGVVYDMPAFAFNPTGTIINADVKIRNAVELVDFATKYNAKQYEPTVSAMLMNDIVFDKSTSAAFNATGGIGAGEAGSFQGEFYGNNKTIKGLRATLSVFYKLTENGLIKDLILDQTTSFEFTLSQNNIANTNLEVAAIVLTSSGANNEVNNVNVMSDINILASNVYPGGSYSLNVGSIIGRAYYGKIINCTYSGKMSIPETVVIGSTSNACYINCGGICGHVTNAQGIIQSSVFSGTINFATRMYGSKAHEVRLGGIVGRFGHNTTYNALDGTESKNIINEGTIIVDQKANGATNNLYYIGGIVGVSNNNIHNVVNKGYVEVKATNTTANKVSKVKLGGIVGSLATNMTVNNCDNKGEVYCNIATDLCAYDPFMAYTTYADDKGYDDVVKNCTNTGNVHAN